MADNQHSTVSVYPDGDIVLICGGDEQNQQK